MLGIEQSVADAVKSEFRRDEKTSCQLRDFWIFLLGQFDQRIKRNPLWLYTSKTSASSVLAIEQRTNECVPRESNSHLLENLKTRRLTIGPDTPAALVSKRYMMVVVDEGPLVFDLLDFGLGSDEVRLKSE